MTKKLLYFFNKNQKRALLMLFSFMLIATILEMLGLAFVFSIVTALDSTNAKDNLFINKLNTFFELDNIEIIPYLLLAFLVFYIIKIVFLTFYQWFESKFLFTYKENLSSRVFKEYLSQNFSYFYNRNTSEFIRNLITEVDIFIVWLVSILKIALEIIVVIGIFCLLAYINLYFTISITITLLFFSFIYFLLFKKKLNTWGIHRQKNIQKKIQFMKDGFEGIKIIKLLGRENFFFNKFKIHNVNLSKISIMTGFTSGLPKLLFELVGIFFLTSAFAILYYSNKNLIEIAQVLSVYVAASFRIWPSANKIVSSLQLIKLHYPAMNVLYDELKNFKTETQPPYKKFSFNKNIFADIKKFKYPNSNNFEISDIKLNISKGQKIGIIGPTASGKSTIIEILAGILEPTEGSIIVDEKPIFSNLLGWQKLIGFVPQKIFILDESLRNNILFGLDKEKYTDHQIISLLKKLSLEKLLKRLPNGLDGNLGEEGINLSGGEIQRIGLCRVLIFDPEILFLDEATSSLDIRTESQILDELKIFKEKTIISIAHRINTLKNCDMIYRFDNGEVVDHGSYDKFKIQN
jgi:ABC-type multidrug transport system fused ATPase/permease subunit